MRFLDELRGMNTLLREAVLSEIWFHPVSVGFCYNRKEVFIFFRFDPFFRRSLMYKKANSKTQKWSPLLKMVESLPSVSVALKLCFYS